jgi:hypothetical protein
MPRRRKKSTKVISRRRRSSRRYSGIGAVSTGEVLALVGGAVASRFVVNALGKSFPNIVSSANTKAIAQIALGLATKPIANIIGVKTPMVDALGKGMIVAGGYELVKVVAPNIMGAADEGDVIVVNGMDEIAELNGMDEIGNANEISEMNGMDEIGEADFYDI